MVPDQCITNLQPISKMDGRGLQRIICIKVKESTKWFFLKETEMVQKRAGEIFSLCESDFEQNTSLTYFIYTADLLNVFKKRHNLLS